MQSLSEAELKSLLSDLAHDIHFYKDKIKEIQDEFLDLVDQKKELVDKYNNYKHMYEQQLSLQEKRDRDMPDLDKTQGVNDFIFNGETDFQSPTEQMSDYQTTERGQETRELLAQGKVEEAHEAFFEDDISLRNHINMRRIKSEAQELKACQEREAAESKKKTHIDVYNQLAE